jgi:WD40 repeat protein
LQGHTDEVKAAAWSGDGIRLATGGNDSLIKVWDTSDPVKMIKALKASSPVRALAFCHRDGVASVQNDGSIILWNINNSAKTEIFPSGMEKPLCILWDSTRKTILAGCSNGVLLVIDPTLQPAVVSRFVVHTTGIDQMAFSSDYTLLATAAWDNVLRIHDYHEFFEKGSSITGVKSIDNLDARARSLLFTSDKKLYAAMSDKSIRIWETSSTTLVSSICRLVNRDLTAGEWVEIIGTEIPYEKTCSENP